MFENVSLQAHHFCDESRRNSEQGRRENFIDDESSNYMWVKPHHFIAERITDPLTNLMIITSSLTLTSLISSLISYQLTCN